MEKKNKLLAFDFETSGKDIFKKQLNLLTYKTFDRALQVCCILYDSDTGEELSRLSHILKVENFIIPEDSIRIHGITQTKMEEEGVPIKSIFGQMMEMFLAADKIVAHNVDFDKTFLKIEIFHLFAQDLENLTYWIHKIDNLPFFCTMKNTIQFCKLPFAEVKPWHKKDTYKFPSLKELHQILFPDEDRDLNFHDAETDTMVCMKCYLKLVEVL